MSARIEHGTVIGRLDEGEEEESKVTQEARTGREGGENKKSQ